MMRNLKTLGLVLVAALAITAVVASAASASFTGSGTGGHNEAEGAGPNLLTAFGGSVGCNNETVYHGSTSGANLTVTPTYTGCTSGSGTVDVVTMHECDFVFAESGTAALACAEEAEEVEVHVFSGATLLCTISIPQQNELESLTYTNQGVDVLRVQGTVSGIKAHREGLCAGGGTQETEEAELHADIIFNGIGI